MAPMHVAPNSSSGVVLEEEVVWLARASVSWMGWTDGWVGKGREERLTELG